MHSADLSIDRGFVADVRPPQSGLRARTMAYALALAAVFALGLIASLFFKPAWLWMDEVLSAILIGDPSLAHMNAAVASGMDANPPLFPNLYWLLARALGQPAPLVLRAITVLFFASALALFYRYTTRLIPAPTTNLILITLGAAFTYLNLTLATQIRSYGVTLLLACLHFVVAHRLLLHPRHRRLLVAHVGVGALLAASHNFGLIFLAASAGCFVLMLLWSRERGYLWPLAAYATIVTGWVVLWYPSFAVQAAAGQPHSWIPLPTFASFFAVSGELAPSLSSRLERAAWFPLLPMLRFGVFVGLFLFIALPKLKRGVAATLADPAFVFYLLSGIVSAVTLLVSVTASFTITSVFISRYLWPAHLLLLYQLVYAYHHFFPGRSWPRLRRLIPAYLAVLALFVFFQNRKIVVFPTGILSYLPQLTPGTPVFVETADYFLPLWYHFDGFPVRYVLDWETASRPGNLLSTTVEHKILKSVREHYHLPGIVPVEQFTAAAYPRFYIVDEAVIYGMERFLDSGQATIVREIPTTIPGHRLLEAVMQPAVATLPAGADTASD